MSVAAEKRPLPPAGDGEEDYEAKRRRILEETRDIDADDSSEEEDEDSDDESEDDEDAELQRELERVRREREEKKKREVSEIFQPWLLLRFLYLFVCLGKLLIRGTGSRKGKRGRGSAREKHCTGEPASQ